MAKEQKGKWVKYEKAPGKWQSEDSSYTRLCDDLKDFPNTGWNLGALADDIYGEFLPCHGTEAGDVYVYYVVDEGLGERIPKILLKVKAGLSDDKKPYVVAWGVERLAHEEDKKSTFELHASLLSVALEKFIELDAKDWAIEDYNKKLKSYQELLRIAHEGVKTNADIVTIYQNFGRTDTPVARDLVENRCVQADYDMLNEEEKISVVTAICKLSNDDLTRLAVLTHAKGALLTIDEIGVLKGSVTASELRCLRYAVDEIRTSKEKMLDILASYKCQGSIFVNNIPHELQLDVDILQALARFDPSELVYILDNIIRDKNPQIVQALQNHEFMASLLQAHFENVLAHPKYVNERYPAIKILGYFPSRMLGTVESEILYGPQPTIEQEELKDKIHRAIVLERKQIREYEIKKANNY